MANPRDWLWLAFVVACVVAAMEGSAYVERWHKGWTRERHELRDESGVGTVVFASPAGVDAGAPLLSNTSTVRIRGREYRQDYLCSLCDGRPCAACDPCFGFLMGTPTPSGEEYEACKARAKGSE